METLLNRRCMHIFHSFDQCAVYTMSQILFCKLFCKSGFSFLGVRYFLENGLLIERIPKELITTPEDLGDQEVEIL